MTGDLWLPGVARAPMSGPRIWMRPLTGRSHLRPVTKLLWHTTEGSTIEGAEAAYKSRAGTINGVHPHMTVDPYRRRIVQHVALNKSSYSIMDWNDRRGVIQVEVVGHAAEVDTWPESWWRWLATDVAAPIVALCPLIDLSHWPKFYGQGDGIVLATSKSSVRMTRTAFDAFVGQCGHQHAPSPDTHWDPGRWRADLIFQHSTDPATGQGGSMNVAQGDTGPKVEALQRLLNMFSKAGLVVDGDFGPATRAAVVAYQARLHVPATGVWGVASVDAQAAFVEWLKAQPATAPDPTPAPADPLPDILARLRQATADLDAFVAGR